MNKQDFIEMGFKAIPTFNVGNALNYDLKRRRHLSATSIGTPNEMLFICSTNKENNKEITDVIVLHNFDYDGLLTKEKVEAIIKALES